MVVKKIVKCTADVELDITSARLLKIEEADSFLTHKEMSYVDRWVLMSTTEEDKYMCYVSVFGETETFGIPQDDHTLIRPALEINNLQNSKFKVGDTFMIKKYEFKIISDNLAWMCKDDIGRMPYNKKNKRNLSYECSDVKKYIDEWLEELVEVFE